MLVHSKEHHDRLSDIEANVGVVSGVSDKVQVSSILRLVYGVAGRCDLLLLNYKASTFD